MSDGLNAGLRRSLVLCVLLTVTGCAAHYTVASYSDPYGFFGGLLHGVVAPLAVLLKLLDWLTNILGVNLMGEVYAVGQPNTGLTYWIGFILGLSFWSGSGQ